MAQNAGTLGLEGLHWALRQRDSGAAAVPCTAPLSGASSCSLLHESEEKADLP